MWNPKIYVYRGIKAKSVYDHPSADCSDACKDRGESNICLLQDKKFIFGFILDCQKISYYIWQ